MTSRILERDANDLHQIDSLCLEIDQLSESQPFSDAILNFLGDLSTCLLADEGIRHQFPDAATFGYFIRASQLKRAKDHYARLCDISNGTRRAQGLAVQFAPSNVEVLAFYSWAIALMCGCPTVVRLSTRRSEMSDRIIKEIELLVQKNGLSPNWMFISYPRSSSLLTGRLSAGADLLVLWGGNDAVKNLRENPHKASTRVLPFPTRESVAIISAQKFVELSEKSRMSLSAELLKDILQFGQNACSSPRSLIWINSSYRSEARRLLLTNWSELSSKMSEFEPDEMSERRTFAFEVAARARERVTLENCGSLLLISMSEPRSQQAVHPGYGTITEHVVDSLEEASQYLSHDIQTVVQLGFSKEELRNWARTLGAKSPLRIVEAGRSADFSLFWDGYDLIYEFTRAVTVQ